MNAATEWAKFTDDPTATHLPQPGEWCLWSFVTKNGREYYSGAYFVGSDGVKRIRTEYGWCADMTDAYFARVNKLPASPTTG
jgi:hypothetical protein